MKKGIDRSCRRYDGIHQRRQAEYEGHTQARPQTGKAFCIGKTNRQNYRNVQNGDCRPRKPRNKAEPRCGQQYRKRAERTGTLFAAGLIVGESLIGVIMALIIALSVTSGGSDSPLALNLDNWGTISEFLGLAFFIGGILIFIRRVMKTK